MNRTTCTLVLAIMIVGLVGCGSSLTQSSYDQNTTGMSVSEVQSILGFGTEQGSADASFGGLLINAKTLVWQDGNTIITVSFSKDEVVGKAKIGF